VRPPVCTPPTRRLASGAVHHLCVSARFARFREGSAAAGRTARLTPGDKLSGGRVTQAEIGGPVYFRLTPAGDAAETWHPRFMYYGFRYDNGWTLAPRGIMWSMVPLSRIVV
jgi:hypothetical protein